MEKYDQLPGFQQGLEEILREGARKMLHQAIEGEVEAFTKRCSNSKDENGHKTVKRSGYLPERKIQAGVGPIKVKSLGLKEKSLQAQSCQKKFLIFQAFNSQPALLPQKKLGETSMIFTQWKTDAFDC